MWMMKGEVCGLNWIHGETLPEADHFFMGQPPKTNGVARLSVVSVLYI
jgi:hypothetical protein